MQKMSNKENIVLNKMAKDIFHGHGRALTACWTFCPILSLYAGNVQQPFADVRLDILSSGVQYTFNV